MLILNTGMMRTRRNSINLAKSQSMSSNLLESHAVGRLFWEFQILNIIPSVQYVERGHEWYLAMIKEEAPDEKDSLKPSALHRSRIVRIFNKKG